MLLPQPGQFLIGREVYMTCPRCGCLIRPWVDGKMVTCGHCGFKAEVSEDVLRRINPSMIKEVSK